MRGMRQRTNRLATLSFTARVAAQRIQCQALTRGMPHEGDPQRQASLVALKQYPRFTPSNQLTKCIFMTSKLQSLINHKTNNR
ncbi:hypothetical protein CHELA20_50967 [Hyphomicrobiales bacterium]|nr:hypothetical protein CHELA20_50967 [Hyphomicrobiales bacterium]CAH1675002.1 hypothetical protein CHELA41_24045 [Hyphomicrobiales bacterium]